MKKDFVINGIHIGEHSYEIEKIEEEIYERAIKTGSDFVMLRPIRVKNTPTKVRWNTLSKARTAKAGCSAAR